MFLLYFFVWVIFNGKITVEIAIFGLAVAGGVYVFTCRFLNWSPKKDWEIVRKSGQIIAYIGLLLREIARANASTLAIVLAPGREPEPVLVRFKTKLRSKTGRVLLANSITLTPGTITVSLEKGELTVHCLDRSFAQGLQDSIFEQALLKLEAPVGLRGKERS